MWSLTLEKHLKPLPRSPLPLFRQCVLFFFRHILYLFPSCGLFPCRHSCLGDNDDSSSLLGYALHISQEAVGAHSQVVGGQRWRIIDRVTAWTWKAARLPMTECTKIGVRDTDGDTWSVDHKSTVLDLLGNMLSHESPLSQVRGDRWWQKGGGKFIFKVYLIQILYFSFEKVTSS